MTGGRPDDLSGPAGLQGRRGAHGSPSGRHPGDTAAVGGVLWDLAHLGSKHAECCLHGSGGRESYETMSALREEGAEGVGMSSVGPAVFALSARPEVWERWQERHGSEGAGCALVVAVDNAGARVRLDGTPGPYHLEAWWHEPHTPAGSACHEARYAHPGGRRRAGDDRPAAPGALRPRPHRSLRPVDRGSRRAPGLGGLRPGDGDGGERGASTGCAGSRRTGPTPKRSW